MNKLLMYTGIAVLTAGLVAGCGRLGDRVDRQIELVGSELTGVPVTAGEVEIGLARGLGEIRDFTVANPDGYVATNAIEVEVVRMNLGIFSTLAGDPLTLDELYIHYPVVNFEKNAQGGSNIEDISENAEKNMAEADRKSAAEEPASEEKPGEPFRIVIRKLVIEGVTLNARLADGATRSGTLPGIELTGVGGEEGVKPGGLGLVVLGAIGREMLKQAVARELIEGAGNIRDALSAGNILESLADGLNLTPGQLEKVRPVAESVSAALAATIDAWVAQGFVDRESLSRELEPLLEKSRMQLADALDSKQAQALRSSLTRLEEEAVEVIRFAVVEMVTERLSVTPGQAAQLRPMLRENLVEMSRLLSSFAAEPGRSFEEFKIAYDELRKTLRSRLRNVLDADQLKIFNTLQEDLVERIRSTSFTQG